MYVSIYEKAAAYLYHLARNHPFVDGNKRTAHLATLTFLEINQISRNFRLEDLEEIVVDVSEGKIDKKQLAVFLQNGTLPKMQLLL